jgi:diguanylate cyclase (GGDEF)-like protein
VSKEEALEILEEVKEYVKENQLKQLEINISFDLFKFYLEHKMFDKIEKLSTRLENIIVDFDSNNFYSDYYKYMSLYYKGLEKYREAYESLEKHNNYLDAVHSSKELQEISNVRSEGMQKQLEQLQILSEIGRDINAMASVDNIFDAIYDYLERFFEDYSLLLGILGEDSIHYVYNKNRGSKMKPYTRKLENNTSLATWAIKNEKMVVINDLENEFSMYVDKLVVYFDTEVPQSVIVIPLKVEDEVIGVMNFQTMKKDMLTIERVEMFRIISSYAAIAVKNSLHSKELEDLSNKDQLTGLYNWRYYDKKMKELLSDDLHTFTLFVLDIDHFKNINDKFGHSVGNLCLKQLAKVTQKALKDSEFIARIGGEEFAVIYVNKNRKEVIEICSNFVKIVEEKMAKVGNINVSLTISIGVAFYSKVIDLIPDEIFKTADKALYNAKDSGRNNAKYIFN